MHTHSSPGLSRTIEKAAGSAFLGASFCGVVTRQRWRAGKAGTHPTPIHVNEVCNCIGIKINARSCTIDDEGAAETTTHCPAVAAPPGDE